MREHELVSASRALSEALTGLHFRGLRVYNPLGCGGWVGDCPRPPALTPTLPGAQVCLAPPRGLSTYVCRGTERSARPRDESWGALRPAREGPQRCQPPPPRTLLPALGNEVRTCSFQHHPAAAHRPAAAACAVRPASRSVPCPSYATSWAFAAPWTRRERSTRSGPSRACAARRWRWGNGPAPRLWRPNKAPTHPLPLCWPAGVRHTPLAVAREQARWRRWPGPWGLRPQLLPPCIPGALWPQRHPRPPPCRRAPLPLRALRRSPPSRHTSARAPRPPRRRTVCRRCVNSASADRDLAVVWLWSVWGLCALGRPVPDPGSAHARGLAWVKGESAARSRLAPLRRGSASSRATRPHRLGGRPAHCLHTPPQPSQPSGGWRRGGLVARTRDPFTTGIRCTLPCAHRPTAAGLLRSSGS